MPRIGSAFLDGVPPDAATDMDDLITGTRSDETINSRGGDDIAYGGGGDDIVRGDDGFDVVFGGNGADALFGGTGGDFLYGGKGPDVLFGDSGFDTAKGADLSADRLVGGTGRDRLVQGDGNDVMTGGAGPDEFLFRWQDPMVALAAGTGRAFTTITDFDTDLDRMRFDVAGVGDDRSVDVNFVDGGADDGNAGGKAATFFEGEASASNGQAVMVFTEEEFLTGADAVLAAQGEANGDLILYYNETVGAASLLFVDDTDSAHSIARFTNIESVEDLAAAGFSANDFVFV